MSLENPLDKLTMQDVFHTLQPELQITNLLGHIFPPKLARELALELDVQNFENKDWRTLAELMGLSPAIICWLEHRTSYGQTSPTLTLLTVIAGVYKGHSLSKLKEYLNEMEYVSCMELIDSFQGDACVTTEENTSTPR